MAIKKTVSKPTTPERRSLADLWDDTDASEASNLISEGEHEVRINSMELKEDKKKGEAVFVEFESLEGDDEGKTIRQMYKLRDAEGGKGPGLAYLMRDLALLGYDDVPGAKLKKTLKEITEEQPMVVINVKTNGQYTNAYLQGTLEDAGGKGSKGDADDDDADSAKAEIEVGSKVTFTDPDDDDETLTGEVTKINTKKGTATVDVDGDDKIVDLDDLTLAEEEEEKPKAKAKKKPSTYEPEVGDDVKWTDAEGDDWTGTVKKINTAKGTAIVTDQDDDDVVVKLDELEEND